MREDLLAERLRLGAGKIKPLPRRLQRREQPVDAGIGRVFELPVPAEICAVYRDCLPALLGRKAEPFREGIGERRPDKGEELLPPRPQPEMPQRVLHRMDDAVGRVGQRPVQVPEQDRFLRKIHTDLLFPIRAGLQSVLAGGRNSSISFPRSEKPALR